ncbi:hypothetical protein FG386_001742 [Cryptosporidium ryanae]|uniref:uncharacterized protein n=1 Tax=Cryptosporidium ryanae TaxID=515981 RepID=UPI00351A9D2D|nr:hypothetical protein FG386_001742 [Cryptosporidium ryanae]
MILFVFKVINVFISLLYSTLVSFDCFFCDNVLLLYKGSYIALRTSLNYTNEKSDLPIKVNNESYNFEFENVIELVDDEKFEKPITTKRKYRFVKLSNGLKVFMVQDKDINVSIGSLIVRAGFEFEPHSFPGLSRFLQYSIILNLFTGYPKEDAILNDNTINISTKAEREKVRYNFAVSSEKTEETLRLFSNIFTNINISDEIDKELINSLNTEMDDPTNADLNRLVEVVKELIIKEELHHSNSDIKNLNIISDSSEHFKEKMLEYFRLHYNARNMTFVLLSNISLNEQTRMVGQFFSRIENHLETNYRYIDPTQNPLLSLTSKNVLFYSNNELPKLKILFPLRIYISPYRSSLPELFFTSFISSKRKGSLYYFLSNKELVTDIKVGFRNFLKGYSSFFIEITFFKDYKLNVLKVLRGIFSVFEMMRNADIDLELVELIKKLDHSKFMYKEDYDLFDECFNIQNSVESYNCPPEKVLSAPFKHSKFNEELQKRVLLDLTPENMLLILHIRSTSYSDNNYSFLSKKPNIHLNKPTISDVFEDCEESETIENNSTKSVSCNNILSDLTNFEYNLLFYQSLLKEDFASFNSTGALYALKPIHPCVITFLKKMVNSTTAFTDFEVSKPDLKLFDNLKIFSSLHKVEPQDVPIRLSEAIMKSGSEQGIKFLSEDIVKDYQRFFYFPSHFQKSLKTNILIYLKLPFKRTFGKVIIPFHTKKLDIIFFIIVFILRKSLDDINFYLEGSLTHVSFSKISPFETPSTAFGISIEISGYVNHIISHISIIAQKLASFRNYINNSNFKLAKRTYFNRRKNSSKSMFSNQFSYIERAFMFNHDASDASIMKVINEITLEDVVNVSNVLASYGRMEGWIFGNVTPMKSRELILLFSINLGRYEVRNEAKKKESNLDLSPGYLMLSFIKSVKFIIFNLFSNLFGDICFSCDVPIHLSSNEHKQEALSSFSELRVVDLLSLKEDNFYYHEVSSNPNVADNSVMLTVIVDYYTRETDILADLSVFIISKYYLEEFMAMNNYNYFISIEKRILLDRTLAIRALCKSSNYEIQSLVNILNEFFNSWFNFKILSLTDTVFQDSKQVILESLHEDISDMSIMLRDFKNEIYSKRYDFDKKSAQIDFLSDVNYSSFRKWCKNIWPKSKKLLFGIYSQKISESEYNELQKYVPDGYVKIKVGHFFNQKNIKSFSPITAYDVD